MLERDIEVSLSIDPINRPGNYPWYTVAGDDVPRIQLMAPMGITPYSQIWWNPPTGFGTSMVISGAGAITFSPNAGDQHPMPARSGAIIETRLNPASARSAAITSLILRGPNSTYAEFANIQLPSMTLCDGTGKGWKYTLLADGTGFSPASAVSGAVMAQNINSAAWAGADGRTVLGSERSGTKPGSLRVQSSEGYIEINWVAGKTYIRMKRAGGGSTYYDVAPDNLGALA